MAILIKPSGEITNVSPKSGKYFSLKELQGFVGGLIEVIDIPGNRSMYLNEEGKYLGLGVNLVATAFLILAGGVPGDYVMGTIAILDHSEINFGDDA